MRIKELTLFTNSLEQERTFYSEKLGFELVSSSSDYFTVKVGWSTLTFKHSEKAHVYHYCFLIPSNKLAQALEWMESRVSIIQEEGKKTQRFESWNANSFYFYDASGNIAEFIVRHDLNNAIDADFDTSHVLCVNEIGMPTKNIGKSNAELETKFGTAFWKGNLERFGTHGSQEGLILLPNYEVKDVWFPTSKGIKPEPFELSIEHEGMSYSMEFLAEE
jgi:catechol-2,3-dioxygenase